MMFPPSPNQPDVQQTLWAPNNPVRQPQPALSQLRALCVMELMNFRWTWRPTVITGVIAPIIFITLMGYFALDESGSPQSVERLAYILSGNVIITLMFTNMSRMASRFAWMRHVGTLDYFATLPVSRYLLIIAVLLSFFVISLPAIIATLIYGFTFLGLPVNLHPALLLVIPLAALSLAGIGAYIGIVARNMEEANTMSQVLLFIFMIMGPVLIPLENLPTIMRAIGIFSPATYAASALRQTLLGPTSGRLLLDLAVLIGFTAASFYIVNRKMDWRL